MSDFWQTLPLIKTTMKYLSSNERFNTMFQRLKPRAVISMNNLQRKIYFQRDILMKGFSITDSENISAGKTF